VKRCGRPRPVMLSSSENGDHRIPYKKKYWTTGGRPGLVVQALRPKSIVIRRASIKSGD